MKKKEALQTGSIALTPAEWKKLDQKASKAGRSRNNYIRMALIQHLGQTTI